MRIIGGAWRGRKLPVMDVPDLRPTGDRIRETLFNWLQFEWEGGRWLDMFSGTGALAFEALSRGAAEVTMLEKNATAFKQIQSNKTLLKAEGAKPLNTDAMQWIVSAPKAYFDGIFLDPPFKDESLLALIDQIITSGILKPQGWLYIEQPRERDLSQLPLTCYRHQQAGAVQYGLWHLPAA